LQLELWQDVTILVATSGDTGSAVADGFAGQDNIDVVLLYPKGLVSEVQERQLIVKRPGVRSLAVDGSFDACQAMVKAAFVDLDLAHLPLSSANSINIGRLLPQMLYYIWAVKQAVDLGHSEVNICVPSGNLGNFSAGFIASKMGLPVKQFVVTHNANHFFPKYLSGSLDAFEFNETVATLSNAMDVGSPSNFERLHHLFGDEHLRQHIWSTTISDETTQTAMKNIYNGFDNYISCPHTAVGLQAVLEYRNATGDTTPFISLATAHPAKFPDALEGVGIQVPTEPALQKLFAEETNVKLIPAEVDALKDVLLERVPS